jgi:hypothetical protein
VQGILFGFVVMAAAVHFDDHVFFGTVKIHNVIANDFLAVKV